MKMKRTFVIVLFLVVVATYVYYQLTGLKESSPQLMPIKVAYGIPLVKVNIQGYLIDLVLDLGAHDSSLTRDIIKKTGLKNLKEMTRSVDIYGKISTHQLFSSSKTLIENNLFNNMVFIESKNFNSDFEPNTPQILTSGRIGRKPFLNKILIIDRRRELCLIEQAHLGRKVDPRQYEQGDWIKVQAHLDKGIGVNLRLITDSGEVKNFILDTGSNVSLIDRKNSPQVPIDFFSKVEQISLKLDKNIPLGTFSFCPFNFADIGFDGILGFDFFDHYIVCIDFVNREIFLKSYE